jgi:macrolide-specific efflux system membrane fusion protein
MKHVKLSIVIGLVVLVGGGFGIDRYRANRTPAVSYRSETVTRTTISTTILATGSVKPVTRVDIKSPTAGRAEQVLVNEGDHVKKNQVLVLSSSTERAALLDAAREHGAAEYKRWQELEKPIPILAPIDGEVILRAIEPGQTFATTDAILAMSDRLMVEALVDETDIAQVKKGQEASIILDAYPNDPFTGKVYKIAYDATTTNNVTTYHVDILPEKIPEFMRSGMTANVTFEITHKDDVLAVPSEAIKSKGGVSTVLMPSTSGNKNDPPVAVEVQTGMTDGKKTEIVSGLNEGATILIVQANTTAAASGTNPFMPSRVSKKRPTPGSPGSGRARN